jgi:hypothetical protein
VRLDFRYGFSAMETVIEFRLYLERVTVAHLKQHLSRLKVLSIAICRLDKPEPPATYIATHH